MTKNDLDTIFSDDFRRAVESNLHRDPVDIALDGRVAHASMVASQVKYLRRAAEKLPSWFAARCVFTPLAFEQSSSEAAAARKNYSGRTAIDLTCGLGVDAFCLSRRFDRVIAVERDPLLAAITRENLKRLGVDNVLVVNDSSERFLSGAGSADAALPPDIDLVYADPDRRDDKGRKMVTLSDCSPDILALMPRLKELSPRLAVKLSPMFDVDEVFRLFGPRTVVEVVSWGGECREVVVEVSFGGPGDVPGDVPERQIIRAVAIGLGVFEASAEASKTGRSADFEPARARYLVVPDVALQKARLARRYFSERGVWIASDNGFGFAMSDPGPVMGRVYEIESIEPFDPKGLRRRLKAHGVKGIEIMRREFPLSAADIARQIGVREGGATTLAFTRPAGRLWQIHLKNR